MKYGAVAQLGERRTCTAEVAGSIPVSSTNYIRQVKSNDWSFDSTDETDQTVKDVWTCLIKRVVSQLGDFASALDKLVRVHCNPQNVLVPEWLRGWIANPLFVGSIPTQHSDNLIKGILNDK